MSGLSTKHIVLGLLVEREGYGYEIEQRVTYKAIDRLQEEGLIEPVRNKAVGGTERGPPRVIYGVTESGQEEFSRWLAEPCEIGIAREDVHVKLVLAQRPNWPRLIELTESLEKACLAAIHDLQAGDRPTFDQLADPEIPWDTVSAVLVDDAQCARLQAMIDWLQRVRIVVRHRMDPPARRLKPRA